ncbi:MFS transporter [Paenibacillus sp. JX-17]|uniref:MFS transporter n=1 Tax=Paenibacillus lacisoli TaxID=3064525 RepID=A0ABT9CG93_9BACL|nr:MFS transporter [Paenibacillus sp. JX-17]MDO7908272.1 MFS transporter [Paenibacillus sp. JX-17]
MMERKAAAEERTPGGSLLRNRAFVSLMLAQMTSNIGGWLYLLALLTLLGIRWQATPWEITMVTLCSALPFLVGGPFAGALADRMDRKKLMIGSDAVRAVLVIGLVFAVHLWQVYLILIVKGVFDILFSPAKSGKLKEVVPDEQIQQAVSISSFIEQGAKIAGPAIGGVLVGLMGIQGCFIFNAVTFVISGLLLFGIPGGKVTAGAGAAESSQNRGRPERERSFLAETGAGIRYLIQIPLLGYGTLLLSIVLLVLQLADSQTIVLFRDIPGIREDLLGWCITASGVGTLMAAALTGRWKGISHLGKMGIGAALMGLIFGLIGPISTTVTAGTGTTVMMILGFLLAGMGGGFSFIPFQVILQERTPVHMTGRVFGTVNSLTSASSIIGPVLGGLFVTAYGTAYAFAITGAALFVLSVVVLMTRAGIERKDAGFQVQKTAEVEQAVS